MSSVYIDRANLFINGVFLQDVISGSINQNYNVRPVATMSTNQRVSGFVAGNVEFDGEIVIAVSAKLATPKLEAINPVTNNIQLTFEHGGDRYLASNVQITRVQQSASGVGTEGRKTFGIVFTELTDQVGNSALFNITANA